MFDSNYHCFHKWKRWQNQWMILQIQRLQPHPRARCGSWASWTISKRLVILFFVFFLTTIFLLAICFKYYCSATSKKLTWHKIDLSIFSHFPDIGSWLDLLYCAKSNALILANFNPLQRPLKVTWWYILTIQWNDENCYPLPLLLISRDVPLNSIICWSLTLKALTGTLKRSLTRITTDTILVLKKTIILIW